MPKTSTSGAGGSGRTRRRLRARLGGSLVAALAVLTLLAACGTGGSTPPPDPPPDGGAASTVSDPPQDALPVTAAIGRDQLPPGMPGTGKPPVTIGSKDFLEQTLLGQLYLQALAAKGYTVTLKDNIGRSEVIDTALSSNQIQMYPEYLGEIVTSVAGQPTPASASDTYTRAKMFEEQQRGATVLKQTPFQDTDAVAVTTQTARQYGLRTISELNKITPGGTGTTIAARPEFATRQTGLLGVQKQYDLPRLGFLSAASGQQYRALDTGTVAVAGAFSTDAALQSGKYTLLTDPKNVFGFQYVAPVVKQNVLTQEGPEFAATCNWVSSLLTTQVIQALNGEVQGNRANAASIAEQFLTANGLK